MSCIFIKNYIFIKDRSRSLRSNLSLILSQILILTLSIIISQSLWGQENQKIGILNPLIYDVKIPKKAIKELNKIIRSEVQNQLKANQQLIDETISQTNKIFEQQSICQEECKIKLKSNKELLIDEACQMRCEINIGKSINANLLITSRLFRIKLDHKQTFYLLMIAFDVQSFLFSKTTKIKGENLDQIQSFLFSKTTKIKGENLDQIQKSLKESIRKFMVETNTTFSKSHTQISIPPIDVWDVRHFLHKVNQIQPFQDSPKIKINQIRPFQENQIQPFQDSSKVKNTISDKLFNILIYIIIISSAVLINLYQEKNQKHRKKGTKKNINDLSFDIHDIHDIHGDGDRSDGDRSDSDSDHSDWGDWGD
jgi:hypothetical protein